MDEVEYRLILRDEFSKSLHVAKEHVDRLESSFDKLKETAMHMAEAFAVFEIGKEAINSFEGLQKANAQLEASLTSTGHAAGLTSEELSKQREELSKTSLSTETAIASMQSLLLTFTNVKGETFNEASKAIEDMAAKLNKGDLQGTAIQVGKALQDPIHGITALHKAGVNFSETQKEVIKHLVDTGKTAKAQQLILHELSTEFGGSAAAALNAAPMEALKKQWEEVLVKIGEALEKIIVEVRPYIQELFNGIKSVISFMENHTTSIKVFTTLILGVGLAMKAQALWTAFSGTAFFAAATQVGIFAAAEGQLTAAQWSLNAAMDANPIGVIILAIAALTAGIIALTDNYEKLKKEYEKTLETDITKAQKDALFLLNKQVEDSEKILGYTKERAEKEALIYQQKKAQSDLDEAILKRDELKIKMKKDFTIETQNKYNEFQEDIVKASARKAILAGDPFSKKTGIAAGGLGIPTKTTEKIKGTSNVTINVSINKLVEMIKIEAKNIKDGVNSAGSDVAKALLSAVDQFSASADI